MTTPDVDREELRQALDRYEAESEREGYPEDDHAALSEAWPVVSNAARAYLATAPATAPAGDASRRALEFLASGRDTHVQWLEYLNADPAGRGYIHPDALDAVGDSQWHKERIAGYDCAIATLRAALGLDDQNRPLPVAGDGERVSP